MSDIRCENCGRKIAEGEKPVPIKIKCRKCNHLNDLSAPDTTKPFTDRLPIEKK
jgi:phage FluMu protein Com